MMRLLVISMFTLGWMTVSTQAVELPLPVSEIERSEPVDFAGEIMPILKRNCLACHHEKEAEGGLILETVESIRKGGDSGHGVVPQDVDASLVFARARGTEEPLMPPEDNTVGAQPLTPEELGLLRLWIQQGAEGSDASQSEMIQWQPIPESIRTVYAMDVTPDGQLAIVGRGNRIALIDLVSGGEVGRLVDPSLTVGEVADVDLIQSIATSPDGLRIATGGFRTVRLWKKVTRRVDPSTTPLASATTRLAAKADGTAVALVNAIGDIEIWDLANNTPLQTLAGHRDRITGLVWAGGADRVFSADESGLVIAWNPLEGNKVAEFDAGAALLQLAASQNGKHAAAIDSAGKVHLLALADDGKSLTPVTDVAQDVADATAVALAGSDALTLIAATAGGVKLFAVDQKKLVRQLDHGAVVDALAVTSDQARLVTGGRDGKTRIWNLADGKPVLTMEGDPQIRLQLASADRNATRQKATVARLNQKTDELEKLLAKEDEVLKKATEEKDKAVAAREAEEKKRVDAVALVTATEAKIAKAASDTEQAKRTMTESTKMLAMANTDAEKVAQQIAARMKEIAAAEKAVADAQAQIDAFTEAKNKATASLEATRKLLAQQQTAMKTAKQQAAKAQSQIDAAKTLTETAKAETEKATKELEEQKKAVAAAEEAKKKSEAEVNKRQQAFAAATSAQQRAQAAIPTHKTVIEEETRRQQILEKQLAETQALFSAPANQVVSVAVSADNATVATAHANGSIRSYRASDGQPLMSFDTGATGKPTQVAWVGDTLCGLSDTASPTLMRAQSDWQLERTIGSIDDGSIISDRVTAIDFRQDGKSIAIGSGPPSRFGEVKVFSVASGQLVRDFGEVHSDTVLGLEFSPDGRQVASSSADKTIRLLDIASGQVTRRLEGHTHHVLAIAWQDDGQTIASASADQSIKIWNTETGEQRRTISGFSKEVTAVSFVQTSNQIVTACADGNLRLSDTSNGKAIRNFGAGGDFLFTLQVTPDGKKLLAGGQSGVVRIWNLADGKLISEVK